MTIISSWKSWRLHHKINSRQYNFSLMPRDPGFLAFSITSEDVMNIKKQTQYLYAVIIDVFGSRMSKQNILELYVYFNKISHWDIFRLHPLSLHCSYFHLLVTMILSVAPLSFHFFLLLVRRTSFWIWWPVLKKSLIVCSYHWPIVSMAI